MAAAGRETALVAPVWLGTRSYNARHDDARLEGASRRVLLGLGGKTPQVRRHTTASSESVPAIVVPPHAASRMEPPTFRSLASRLLCTLCASGLFTNRTA